MVDKKIKEGYKRTEIGIIPEDWDMKSLGQIGIFSKGKGIKKDESRSGTIPCVRYGEIYTFHNDYIKSYNSFISREIAKTSKQLKKGDLLFAGSGETKEEIGKCVAFIDDIEAYVGGDVIILSPKFGEPLFYGYLLNAPFIVKQKSSRGQGDAIVHIYASSLSDILVPIPQQTEQNNIANSLVDIDKLLQSLEKLIDKKKKIKQGTMQQLLTGKKRLPEFSGDWENTKVKDFGLVFTGGTPPTDNKEYWHGVIPWVTPSDINERKNIFNSEREITSKGLSYLNILPPNTILVTCIASIGKNAILQEIGSCNQQINAIVPNSNFNADYIYYLMESKKSYLLANAGTTATSIISKKEFSELEFIVPKKDEQVEISEILSDMDSEIETLQHKLDKYKKIKQGMMQELLTGRIRLI